MAGTLQSAGHAVLSMQWGAWAGAGMAARDAGILGRLATLGYGVVTPPEALCALEGLLHALLRGGGSAPVAVTVSPLDGVRLGSHVPHVEAFLEGPRGPVMPQLKATVQYSVPSAEPVVSSMPFFVRLNNDGRPKACPIAWGSRDF